MMNVYLDLHHRPQLCQNIHPEHRSCSLSPQHHPHYASWPCLQCISTAISPHSGPMGPISHKLYQRLPLQISLSPGYKHWPHSSSPASFLNFSKCYSSDCILLLCCHQIPQRDKYYLLHNIVYIHLCRIHRE